jgi:hypothetical protein
MKSIPVLLLSLLPFWATGQDLEPRSLSNAPVGLNFLIGGYGYSAGNILFDPSVPVLDASAQVQSMVVAYARTINFFGMSGKIDAIVPIVLDGYWEGLVNGQPASTTRSGFPDPSIRLSVNFIGSPALNMSEYREYKEKTIVGASLRILAPLGEYEGEKLINLGSNRWTFKPQIGVSRRLNRLVMEGYFSMWLFTPNSNLLDTRMTQKPIYTLSTHVCYLFRGGAWLAIDAGYGVGGRTTVDELPKETQKNVRLGSTLAVPVAAHHALKLNFTTGVDTRIGADFDSITLAWQYRWGGMKPKRQETEGKED